MSNKELINILSEKKKKKDPSIFKDYGDHQEIIVSSSAIRKVFNKNWCRIDELCPAKFWYCEILKQCESEPTDSMLKGLFYESLVLGEGAGGRKITEDDLPRHKRTGALLIDYVRIKELALQTEAFFDKHGIMIIKKGENKNVQKRVFIEEYQDDHIAKMYPNLKVSIKMDVDIISPINLPNAKYDMAVIDLKLTQSLDNTFGDYCWGVPERMDHLQAFMYSFFLDLPFYYVVGQYKETSGDEERIKIFPVNTDVKSKVPALRDEASTRLNETKQKIRDYVFEICNGYIKDLWHIQRPSRDECKTCPLRVHCNGSKTFNSI